MRAALSTPTSLLLPTPMSTVWLPTEHHQSPELVDGLESILSSVTFQIEMTVAIECYISRSEWKKMGSFDVIIIQKS